MSHRVWRLALLWQGTVLDVVTVKKRARLRLRTGEVFRVRGTPEGLLLDIAGEPVLVEPDVVIELPAGHSVVASQDAPEAKAGRLEGIDSTLFHATMIGAAVQACVVSAFVLAPAPTLDHDAGAGITADYRRLIIAPGGTAPQRGAATLSIVGRRPEEGEKPQPARAPGTPRPSSTGGKQLTIEQTLEEMRRVLRIGNDGVDLREAVGEMAMSTAAAPELGAGVGGLAPKDPVDNGAGNGLVGPGESQMLEKIRERIRETDKKKKSTFSTRKERAAPPIVDVGDALTIDVPAAHEPELDAEVKEEMRREVRQRYNGIQACYQSLGLTLHPDRSGRITVEFTLLPSGAVKDVVVAAEQSWLGGVADCVRTYVSETWHLSDRLVQEPMRLRFPFFLQPAQDVTVHDFDSRR